MRKYAAITKLLPFLLHLPSILAKTPQEIRNAISEADLLLVTVASERTDGFVRFERSVREFGLEDSLLVLGMGQEWKGGDVAVSPGGGYKIRLMREALEKYKEKQNLVILFTDSYDVVINGDRTEILKRFFNDFDDARIVFSAEGFCWPDKTKATQYPVVKSGKRYLCSGMFLGHAPDVYDLITREEIEDEDDDQLYYTNIYVDPEQRSSLGLALDSRSKLMQNLNGAVEDVTIELTAAHGIAGLHNVASATRPILAHGNGGSKTKLNELANYLGKAWGREDGCIACRENLRPLDGTKNRDLPSVTLAISIARPTPFLEEFLQRLAELDYPKSRMHLFLHNTQDYHAGHVAAFVAEHEGDYVGSRLLGPEDVDVRDGLKAAVKYSMDMDSDLLFSIDSEAQLTNPNALKALITQNRPILVPALSRPGKLWSNFWGAVSEDGFYARSDDYLDIVQGNRKGVWNVPYASQAVLVQKERLPALLGAYHYDLRVDPDMSFARFCRDEGHFMMVDNVEVFGHLVNSDGYRLERHHPDLYEIFNNRLDWELRYLHPNYSHYAREDVDLPQPCPDVYDFPFLSERMCQELIAEMENFGQWSNGKNNDERLNGGYENVPTRDIHMNQISYEKEWLHILQNFIRPLQEKVFWGYYHNPVHAVMNFVVRYRPDEQASLRPHHDSSTYTIDVSLNRHGVDYEGGGVRFLRYNCSVIGHPVGWSILMPGRLTHYHEGLTTTKGTRYIAISFINP